MEGGVGGATGRWATEECSLPFLGDFQFLAVILSVKDFASSLVRVRTPFFSVPLFEVRVAFPFPERSRVRGPVWLAIMKWRVKVPLRILLARNSLMSTSPIR